MAKIAFPIRSPEAAALRQFNIYPWSDEYDHAAARKIPGEARRQRKALMQHQPAIYADYHESLRALAAAVPQCESLEELAETEMLFNEDLKVLNAWLACIKKLDKLIAEGR